jgi:hypothetical protein
MTDLLAAPPIGSTLAGPRARGAISKPNSLRRGLKPRPFKAPVERAFFSILLRITGAMFLCDLCGLSLRPQRSNAFGCYYSHPSVSAAEQVMTRVLGKL